MNISFEVKPVTLSDLSAAPSNVSQPGNFAAAIGSAISHVETAQTSARTAATDLLMKGQGDIHNVALASQRADLSLELFQQVRNKFVSAYQEIMKMPM